jgi:hypothetical protein
VRHESRSLDAADASSNADVVTPLLVAAAVLSNLVWHVHDTGYRYACALYRLRCKVMRWCTSMCDSVRMKVGGCRGQNRVWRAEHTFTSPKGLLGYQRCLLTSGGMLLPKQTVLQARAWFTEVVQQTIQPATAASCYDWCASHASELPGCNSAL